MAIEAKNVINGTWGAVFLDGEEIAEVTAFQAKEEYQKEEVSRVGTMSKGYKIVSVDGKGSVTMNKVNSRMAKKLGTIVRSGKTPTFTIIGKLADPDALGSERVSLSGVVFDDLTIMDWATNTMGSIEAPFTYEGMAFLDLI